MNNDEMKEFAVHKLQYPKRSRMLSEITYTTPHNAPKRGKLVHVAPQAFIQQLYYVFVLYFIA